MSFNSIEFKKEGHLAQITINRPKAMNALNKEVLTELSKCFLELDQDKEVRCLILTGAGDKAFVAGADIKEMESLDPEEAKEFSRLGQNTFRQLEVLKFPVIAAVNGFARLKFYRH